MINFQKEKQIIRNYYNELDQASDDHLSKVLSKYTSSNYHWRSMYPFGEEQDIDQVVNQFWKPLRHAFQPIQRREDFFFAGLNDCDGQKSTWVVSAGHLLGLFDKSWLGIRPTGKMVFLRYAEFHCVAENKITQTALFFDILNVMYQAGQYPLPPMTGVAAALYPAPKTHDGLLYQPQDPQESAKTLALIKRMADDLNLLNKSGEDRCPPEFLAQTWHDDMIWYGPAGIGASYTIPRYQKQHQYPFRENLKSKVFHGHVARLTEGNYGGFFGWPNLSNCNKGGFLGLPTRNKSASMKIVDLYRRSGEKLAENWIYIDMLDYLYQQGLDVLKRLKELNQIH